MVPVTPDTVKAVYECLIQFPPFDKWKLPAKVNFAVDHLVSKWADYDPETKTIRVSTAKVSTFQSLVLAVAHEIVHAHQDAIGKLPDKNPHNKQFGKHAQQVCRRLGYDPANF